MMGKNLPLSQNIKLNDLIRIDQLGYKLNDLAQAIGLKSRVSEILSKKRKLTIDMIRKLHDTLGIPTDVLIKEY